MKEHPVLVTGAAGFIGARTVEALGLRGTPVVSVDDLGLFDERPEHAGLDFGRRVGTSESIAWLNAERPELAGIIHLGACTDTTEMDEGFLRRVNLEYSQALWEHCASAGIPLIYASSAATYGDGSAGYDDDESRLSELQPLNPYGVSKLQFDQWALEREQAGVAPPAWSGWRFFNVYGFGERHKQRMASVVLQAYDQIRECGRVRLFQSHHPDYEDGGQQRDFVFVDDVVRVLLFALDTPVARGIFNLGTGEARTFADLVRATFAALKRPVDIEYVPTPEDIRERYQYFTQARMQKLRAAGYTTPFTTLEEGVAQYVRRLDGA
ncbi:MAG: ADP-glyceromanno-heptose 6-epimerase, partial [Planctomycetota bacterium]